MGVGEVQRVALFLEIATEGCGDGPRACVDEYHGSCVSKFNSYVMLVPYFKKR